jgi:hypothetical protein
MKLLRATVLGLACALPALCLAQWQWIDKDGRKVFSDQSPPGDVPAKNIIRQPGTKRPAAAEQPVAAAASQPAQPLPSVPKLSGKDKGLEERKKQADAAEAEKKRAEEERLAKIRVDNCERAKRSKVSLDSGIRIARANAKGEREFMDDATRAAETKRLEAVIASDCKPAGAQ